MIIYRMTATFGKLEHQTLNLKPGINILEAPNEWGKSTWCAFLTAMFYGIETRTRSTSSNLADKEKYQPWSGSPMEGSIDLYWNGRKITIERQTRGRIPMGVFRAYETDSGLEITELNSDNCGEKILGVERSVFLRAGFLRLCDLPVTQDESLRTRLNSLVTTGDENSSAVYLEQKLKELKNRCNSSRSNGLIQQVQKKLEIAEKKFSEFTDLANQAEDLQNKSRELDQRLDALKNHKYHLEYHQSESDSIHVKNAQKALEQAKLQTDVCAYNCQGLPSREETAKSIQALNKLNQRWLVLQTESQALPQIPNEPEAPFNLENMTPEQILSKAKEDTKTYRTLQKKCGKTIPFFFALSILTFICGIMWVCISGNHYLWTPIIGIVMLSCSLVSYIVCSHKNRKNQEYADFLLHSYNNIDVREWNMLALDYVQCYDKFSSEKAGIMQIYGDLEKQLAQLDSDSKKLTNGLDLESCLQQWQQVQAAWDGYDDAKKNYLLLERQYQALESVVRTLPEPEIPDGLTYSLEETNRLISDLQLQQCQYQQLLGQCTGKKYILGNERACRQEIENLTKKLERLTQVENALSIAQDALSQATQELQRRFAPRITARAQNIFENLTEGRYKKLIFDTDFTLSAVASGEGTIHSALWRSDGTADQMYFALRLALSEVLTPEAPLILDDALVRFDDQRLKAALNELDKENRQILIFTCQGRENRIYWDVKKQR